MPGRSVRVVAVRRTRMNPRTVRPKNKTAIILAGEPLLLSGPATTTEGGRTGIRMQRNAEQPRGPFARFCGRDERAIESLYPAVVTSCPVVVIWLRGNLRWR